MDQVVFLSGGINVIMMKIRWFKIEKAQKSSLPSPRKKNGSTHSHNPLILCKKLKFLSVDDVNWEDYISFELNIFHYKNALSAETLLIGSNFLLFTNPPKALIVYACYVN